MLKEEGRWIRWTRCGIDEEEKKDWKGERDFIHVVGGTMARASMVNGNGAAISWRRNPPSLSFHLLCPT